MITFEESKDKMLEKNDKKYRIGVSFNGRQFPGGHNILKGLLTENTELIGFLGGTKGIYQQNYIVINKNNI